MIVLSVACAVSCVLLFLGPPMALRLVPAVTGATAVDVELTHPAVRRWGWVLAGVLIVLGLWLSHRTAGWPGVVVGTALLIGLATCARLAVLGVARRRADRARMDVAHACSVLASQIRVGKVAAEALHEAAEDCPVLEVASRAQDLGGDVAEVWRVWARRPGHSGLGDLARAWQVSARTGAPLAPSLDQVSEALSADEALRSVVAGELSAPRATGKIMAVLPFCGLGMGYLLGGDPLRFLLSNPYGWGCLLLGVTLAASGVLWIDRLSQQAVDQV